ncbi:hypothetical protein [Streptomyces radicis]|uniref:Uncharacterized protein n=1 Tax=Streptomyces radicis TaxID=1750517 RepID=A0A3A9W9M1_9ACTN|nr:hypothetical protein [Streptomyces radicis]RKN09399.1 hypothetical protein D7319_13160 [Streptomyces radicis]RKN23003.1 hypothetical protein D7318_13365 [Streptomyces radicis]
MSSAKRSRKPHSPLCEIREEERPTCVGREQVVLVGTDGVERRLCPAHGAALWLTDPTFRFSAKTRPAAVAAVLRQAFGEPR